MPNSLSENQRLLEEMVRSGKLVPAPPPAQLPPPLPDQTSPHDMNLSLTRGPLPPSMVLQTDTARAGNIYNGAVPTRRVLPLPPTANAVSGAHIQSIATIVANQAVAAASTPTTDVDIISALNGSNNLPLAGVVQAVSAYQVNNIAASITVSMVNTKGNFLIAIYDPGNGAGSTPAPGASDTLGNTWVSDFDEVDGGNNYAVLFYVQGCKGGSNTITFAVGPNVQDGQSVHVYEFSGVSGIDTAAGAADTGNASLTTGVPNALVFASNLTIVWQPSTTPRPYTAPGSGWTLISSDFGQIHNSGNTLGWDNSIAEFQFAPTSGTHLTATATPSQVLGSSVSFIVSLKTTAASSYTFQTSDADKLVQVNVSATLTLPSPALANGWQCVVSNSGGFNLTLSPASGTHLNNKTSAITLPAGGSTWLFCDGSNYWSTTITLPQATPTVLSEWINSYNPVTGTFAQSQPAFTDINGNIAVTQINSGTNASAFTFLRGDMTWTALNGIGGVLIKTADYTPVSTDAGKLIAFSATAAGLTIVQSTSASTGNPGSSFSLAYSSNVSAGHLLLAAFSWGNASGSNSVTPSTITDTQGNTWTQIGSTIYTPSITLGSFGFAVYQTTASKSAANTVTFTLSSSQTFRRMEVLEYNGLPAGTLVDVSGTNTGTGTAVTSGNITTTQNNDLILELATANSGANMPAGSGYTAEIGGSGTTNGLYAQDKVLATAGTTSFSGTLSASSDWASMILGIFPKTANLVLPNPPISSSWMVFVQDYGSTSIGVLSSGLQIDGAASNVTLNAGKGIGIFTDGTNYYSFRGGS